MSDKALKYDDGKIDWHSFPLEVLEGLIKVAMAGCDKYERFNCLKPFDNGDQRLFSAAMRHAVACQIDPLAIDEESGCQHGYQAAWNMIMRTYHAERARRINEICPLASCEADRSDNTLTGIVRVDWKEIWAHNGWK